MNYISIEDFLCKVAVSPIESDSFINKFLTVLEKEYPNFYNKWVDWMKGDSNYPDSPRLCLYGFDAVTTGRLSNDPKYFLIMMCRNWDFLTGQRSGICDCCKKEVDDLETERQPIASYDFGPAIKFYENLSMDGGASIQQRYCRSCAIKVMKRVLENSDELGQTCVVFGNTTNA